MSGGVELGTAEVLICEDEPLALRALREYLEDVDWIEIVGEARNGSEALRLAHKLEPDLVFMDVRMPGMSGVEVLRALEHPPAVVFTTAYDEYALPAFELGVVDYLLKPFGKDRLLQTLERVRVRLVGERRSARALAAAEDAPEGGASAQYAERLFARQGGATVPVPVSVIRRIEADGGVLRLVTPSGSYCLDETLGEIQQRLDPADFVRIHRTHLVNLNHVASIRRYDDRRLSVRMDDGTTLVASRRGSRTLREMGA